MPDTSARLALPLLQPGQAQKELFHNEALALIDLRVNAVVESIGVNTPPPSPAIGACWAIGGSPGGAWAGHAQAIAGWTSGGWRFAAALAGMTAWSRADARWAWFDGTGWSVAAWPTGGIAVGGEQVVGGRKPAIADAAGGATVDAEARTAIAAMLQALRSHGLIAT